MQQLQFPVPGDDAKIVRVYLDSAADDAAAVQACVRAAAADLGLGTPRPAIIGHRHFESDPAHEVSVAHSRGLGVLAVAPAQGLAGLGVDTEFAGREISARVQRRILNDEDEPACSDDPLGAWVAKEAAFKALAPRWDEVGDGEALMLRRLWLRDGAFGVLGEAHPRGFWARHEIAHENAGLRLGLAALPA